MTNEQKEKIALAVVTYAKYSNITDEGKILNTIENLTSLGIDDAIDRIIVSLGELVRTGKLPQTDLFANAHLILDLNPDKYKTTDDLVQRLKWLREMNLEYPKMPLSENHQLVLETFTKFNELLNNRFDSFYTGGIMGYLAKGRPLERYHGDLDLFINEQQLLILKELVDSSEDFEFISNMDHKEENGHEYKIVYKKTPMSIGLFLFERNSDLSITTKEYYYENQDSNGQLLVDEYHHTKESTVLSFDEETKFYNGTPYRMMSLESIYNSKKNSRPKDRYDASIIATSFDKEKESRLENEKKACYSVRRKIAMNSPVHIIESSKEKGKTTTK